MRKKPPMPLARGADIVRSTLPTTPETPSKRDNHGRTRNDTYHGNIREYSDTDYAPSISRFLRFHENIKIILNILSESEPDEDIKKDDVGDESPTLPFR